MLLGNFGRFSHGSGHISTFSDTDANLTFVITNDDQCAEAEAATTLHDAGNAINMHDALVEFRPRLAARGIAPVAGARRVVLHAADGAGQGIAVLHRHQQAVDAVLHHFAAAGHVGGDQRQAARGGLHQRPGQALAIARQHHHVHAAQQHGHVVHVAQPGDETFLHPAAHGHLAAVGVAFVLAVAVVRTLRRQGFFELRAEPDLFALLDLVALGTVADVAAIRGLNRAFVAQGLKVMAQRRNVGMAALIDASRLSRPPSCSDCGFALGPRINAGGRVGEATLGVRLLTTEDPDEARAIAEQLSALNDERRAIEAAVQEAAERQIDAQHNRAVLVLAGHGWHPGVIGIVAGRIKEKTGKPAVVIALDEDSGQGKGSGRSISGVDLGAAIIGAKDKGLLAAGGGHAMAAGLTVEEARLDEFALWLDAHLAPAVARASAERAMALDLALTPGGLTPELVETLDRAGPFGMGWPAPRIAVGPVRLVRAELVGSDHVRVIATGQDGASFKAIAFRSAETALGQSLLHGAAGRRLWHAGRANIDDWGSRPQAELHLEDAAWAD